MKFKRSIVLIVLMASLIINSGCVGLIIGTVIIVKKRNRRKAEIAAQELKKQDENQDTKIIKEDPCTDG